MTQAWKKRLERVERFPMFNKVTNGTWEDVPCSLLEAPTGPIVYLGPDPAGEYTKNLVSSANEGLSMLTRDMVILNQEMEIRQVHHCYYAGEMWVATDLVPGFLPLCFFGKRIHNDDVSEDSLLEDIIDEI